MKAYLHKLEYDGEAWNKVDEYLGYMRCYTEHGISVSVKKMCEGMKYEKGRHIFVGYITDGFKRAKVYDVLWNPMKYYPNIYKMASHDLFVRAVRFHRERLEERWQG